MPEGADGLQKRLSRWRGRAFIDIGCAMYVGPVWDTTPHAHHAIQICVGLVGKFRLRSSSEEPWRTYQGALVPTNQRHQLDGTGSDLLLLYLEPESAMGRRIALGDQSRGIHSLKLPEIQALRRATSSAMRRVLGEASAARLCQDALGELGLDPGAGEPMDARVVEAVQRLRAERETRHSLAGLARMVGLSPSRFRHLFFAQMGMSCRSFVLWVQVYDAMLALSRGASLTDAALEAGFSDAAHSTRTFRRMLGIAPSQISGSVTFIRGSA